MGLLRGTGNAMTVRGELTRVKAASRTAFSSPLSALYSAQLEQLHLEQQGGVRGDHAGGAA